MVQKSIVKITKLKLGTIVRKSLLYIFGLLVTFGLGYFLGLNAAKIGLDSPYVKELFASNLHNFIDLAKAALWPLAVVVGIYLFQDDLKRIVDAVTGKATKIEGFGMAIALKGNQPETDVDSLDTQKDAIANIYWLGADIMFTVGCLQEGLAKRFVLHGLKQSIHHAEAVFNLDNVIVRTLNSRYGEVSQLSGELAPSEAKRIAEDLVILRNQIGSAIEANQGGYENGLSENNYLSKSDRVGRLRQ